MNKVIVMYAIFLFSGFYSLMAQNNSFDGLIIESSSANSKTFYYGEPFYVYFKITNTKHTLYPSDKIIKSSHRFKVLEVPEMVTQSYVYAQGGPSQTDRIARFNEYLTYYEKLRNTTLKMQYVSQLPEIISLIPGKDPQKELDNFLTKLKA